ncbi:RNA-binding protein 4.1-like [Protopterus annectens]|uniref:RNA-binding protein 4.1-like n=1 Tax=Protopterus annectens TaxID=7888 RepID=UPI001CFBC1F3|nr:RNA-binding protein 4.1-like [Protopterus annectens]
MVKIFVGNIPSGTTQEELKELFEKYGQVNECDILRNYGFVHMEKEDEAQKAISSLHKSSFKGTVLTVELSTTKMRNATKIYVGNVASTATTSRIKELFEKFGRVVECDIVKDYAFVHMAKEREAMHAIESLNNTVLEGKKLFVTLSKTNPPKAPRGGAFPPPPPPPGIYMPRGSLPPPPPHLPPISRSLYERDYYDRYTYDLYERSLALRSLYDRRLPPPPPPPRSLYRERSPLSRRSILTAADLYGRSSSLSSRYSLSSSYEKDDYYDRYVNGYTTERVSKTY